MTAPQNGPLTLHIGYHKTATTWMQRKLFVAEHGYAQIADHDDVFAHIVQPHGLDFDPAPMRDLIAARRAAKPVGIPVISSEILSGNPLFGGRESEAYAARLAQIAPGARIVISIRNQQRILPSVYMQYLLRGGTMTPAQFFAGTNELGYFGFAPQHFAYDRLVALYQSLFGTQNVYVMTQESLQRDMDGAAQALADFMQNDAFTGLNNAARKTYAASYPEYASPVLRRINHVQRSTLNPAPIVSFGRTPLGLYRLAGYALKRASLAVVLSGRTPVSDHVRTAFKGAFAASNQRLAQIVAHPLDLRGYDGFESPAATP
tara:strand:- start:2961 stop:3914 length:954 start_codon:yes stop_codon:yes gene_type:complete